MARPLSPLVREPSNTVLSSQGEPGEAGEPGLPGEGGPPVSVALEEQGDVPSGNIGQGTGPEGLSLPQFPLP